MRHVEAGLISCVEIDIGLIDPHPNQPRALNTPDDIRDLANDIKARGLLAPPVVTPAEEPGRYTLVAGSRRLDALKFNGAKRVACIVWPNADHAQMLEDALAENIQRESLTDWEEAMAIQQLMDMRGAGVREIARLINKSPAYVSKRLRVFANETLREAVRSGRMSTSTAEELASSRWDADTIKSYSERGASRQEIRELGKTGGKRWTSSAGHSQLPAPPGARPPLPDGVSWSLKTILRNEGLGEIVAHVRDYAAALETALVSRHQPMDEKCWVILAEAGQALSHCLGEHDSHRASQPRKAHHFYGNTGLGR